MVLLKLGHMLVFEAPDGGDNPLATSDVDCSLTTEVRYRLPNGTVKTATISLMFPASSGSVSRIMDSWYAARGELLAILYLHGYAGMRHPLAPLHTVHTLMATTMAVR